MSYAETVHLIPGQEVYYASPDFDKTAYKWRYRLALVSSANIGMAGVVYDLFTNGWSDFHISVPERHLFATESQAKAFCDEQNREPELSDLTVDQLFPLTTISPGL